MSVFIFLLITISQCTIRQGEAGVPFPKHPRSYISPLMPSLSTLCLPILTAAPAPSCHQKLRVPQLQSGSPSAAWEAETD